MTYLTTIIYSAAKSAMVSSWLLLAVCKVESGLRPNLIHHNDGGSASIGLCQLKKASAKSVGFKGTTKDLLDPGVNAYYAALYLKSRISKYKNLCYAVAAYNSGIYHESKKYKGIPRNIKYVRKVQKLLSKDKKKLLTCK